MIHSDLMYMVPGHSIFDNLYLVWDLLELAHRDSLSFALLSLDQEKMFDRVDLGYLTGIVRVFSFSPHFMQLIQVLYASAESMVKLNWTLI